MPTACPNAGGETAVTRGAVRTTDLTLQIADRVGVADVDGHGRTQPGRQVQLGVVDVDGDHLESHRPAVLDGQMSQTTDAGDDHPVTRVGVGHHQALVDGQARADQRRCGDVVEPVGQFCREPSVGHQVFGEATIDVVAGAQLLVAQCLPARQALLTGSAGPVQPRHADPVADAEIVDPGPNWMTSPTASWPGTRGNDGLSGQSPSTACRSVWQICRPGPGPGTWPGPGVGTGSWRSSSG